MKNKELLKAGLKAASAWANLNMMEIFRSQVVDGENIFTNTDIQEIMTEAVMSDSEHAVAIVKTMFENSDLLCSENEQIVQLAISRGKRKILETLNIDTAIGEEVEEPFPLLKSHEMDYNEEKTSHKIRGMVPTPGKTTVVKFDDLLEQVSLPPVHYEVERDNPGDIGRLVQGPRSCSQPPICRTMQSALIIADYIRVKLTDVDLFQHLQPPAVVGSLNESSRLFFYGLFNNCLQRSPLILDNCFQMKWMYFSCWVIKSKNISTLIRKSNVWTFRICH